MCRTFGAEMAARKRGVILNISSDLGLIAPDQRLYRKEGRAEHDQPVKPVTYSVVKTALIGLTRYLATYWAADNVRVNAICPGGVYNNQPDDFVERLTKLIPIGAYGELGRIPGRGRVPLLGCILVPHRLDHRRRRRPERLVSETTTDLSRSALFSLEGRTAVLTGASGFLGATMAEALLENGARVILLGRSERLNERAFVWSQRYGEEHVEAHRVNMYDLQALGDVLDQLAQQEQSVDIIVNNAHELGAATGFNVPEGSLEHSEMQQWNLHFMGGVYWPVTTIQRLLPALRQSKSASIINISTMYAVVAPSPHLYAGTDKLNPPGYSASKAAMLALTRYAASFLGEEGIRANAILPGPFSNTGGNTENSVAEDDPFLQRLRDRTCLGRLGRPEELAGALLYLASDASRFMTGQSLIVDGGWTVT